MQRKLSPYRVFSQAEWAQLRADAPMTLTPEDLARLQGLYDPVSMQEVERVYLPLSRLLALLHETSRLGPCRSGGSREHGAGTRFALLH